MINRPWLVHGAVGFFLGSVVTAIIFTRKDEKAQEIAEKSVEEQAEEEVEKAFPKSESKVYEQEVSSLNYASKAKETPKKAYSAAFKKSDIVHPTEDEPAKEPVEITKDMYDDEFDDYSHVTLLYYKKNKIMTEAGGVDIVEGAETMVGPFAWTLINDTSKDAIYVRDDDESTCYEIFINANSDYYEENGIEE